MFQDLGSVTLKTGEKVAAGAVVCPDAEWRGRIEKLLAHKGEIWRWQNSDLLARADSGIETRFCVLHRDGAPFANVMVAELAGAGIFGHVWTNPGDRRKGASSRLIGLLMDDFRARGGKALFLGTGFDSVAYHLYERHGFRGVEPASGCMAWHRESQGAFDAAYFAQDEAETAGVSWRHWPSSAALFMSGFPGVVRCAPLGILRRESTEGPLLQPIREVVADGDRPRAVAAQLAASRAVVGLAAWGWDGLWPSVCVVDVHCHPDHWTRAGGLLSALRLPEAGHVIAYADSESGAKHEALGEAGFRPAFTLRDWVAADAAKTRTLDVQVYRRG